MADCTLALIAECLGGGNENVRLEKSFVENGGHSLAAFALSQMLRQNGIHITTADILLAERVSDILSIAQKVKLSAIDTCVLPVEPEHTQLDTSIKVDISGRREVPGVKAASRLPSDRFHNVTQKRHYGIAVDLIEQAHTGDKPQRRSDRAGYVKKELVTKPRTSIKSSEVRRCDNGTTVSIKPISIRLNVDQVPVLKAPEFLTDIQLKLLHGTLKIPESNIIRYTETHWTSRVPSLRKAWQKVIHLEPIFRTKLPELYVGDQQVALEWKEQSAKSDLQYRHLLQRALSDTRVGCYFSVINRAPSKGMSRGISTIVWNVHHSLMDGFSLQILIQKVRKAASGVPILPGPSFSKVAKSLQRYRIQRQEHGQRILVSREKQLSASKGYLNLPKPSTTIVNPILIDDVELNFQGTFHNIKTNAQSCGVTPATIFHAAWALSLSKLTDSKEVVFYSVIAGRDAPIPGIDSVIGPLLNTLPFVVKIDPDSSVREYLQLIFRQIVELSDLQWATSGNKYDENIESALAMQFDSCANDQNSAFSPLSMPKTSQMADMPLSVAIGEDGIVCLRYHTHRFVRSHIQRIADMLRQAVNSLCHSDSSIDACVTSMLTVPHLSILREWGNVESGLTTKASVSDDVVTLFEKTVCKWPEAIAAERGDDKMTYRQLDDKASRLALSLKSFVKPGDVIFVHADRSIAWLTAIYGVLKAEAVYCPLDPALPARLKDHMFKVAKGKAFISNSASQQISAPSSCSQFLAIDELAEDKTLTAAARDSHRLISNPEHAAYVCFTSGSTGAPKGVVCTHQGLVAFQRNLEVRLFAQPGKKVAQVMSPVFDGSIHEIFSTLSYGATLVLNPETSDMFENLNEVDSCILTPSMARVLDPRSYPKLKQVYLVGESVPQSLSEKWTQYVDLYNMYGPTEATCGATIKHLRHDQLVTIGSPNPTTRIYIMDSQQKLVMPGAIGEVYLAGVQVSKGYLGMPELTANRFANDPICRIGEQMYKTGDRGYWTEDGEIVLLGRGDREIKLRGYRLDLDDLETRVRNTYPDISAVAIFVKDDNLVAVVEPADVDIEKLRQHISTILPPYAIPSQIVAIAQLPMTTAGKTDYQSLASVTPASVTQSRRQSTDDLTDSTQKMVAEKMLSVLRLDHALDVGPDTDFGELGGTSLDQVSLAAKISKDCGAQIPLKLIIEQPQVAALAKAIDEVKELSPSHSNRPRLGDEEASPIEADWFKKYAKDVGSSAFNVVYAANFDALQVNHGALVRAWNSVLERHQILRSKFAKSPNGRILRFIHDRPPRVMEVESVCVEDEVNRGFDVESDVLIKVFLTNKSILVVMSHIIADFTSLSILLQEAAQVYHGTVLSPVLVTYADSTVWNNEPPPHFAKWWIEYLDTLPTPPTVLAPNRERLSYDGASFITKLDTKLWTRMRDYVSNSNISMQQLALAAAGVALSDRTDKIDIIIGSPYINRCSEAELSSVGLYLEPLPVRITHASTEQKLSPQSSDSNPYLDCVQRSCQDALAHAIPWHRLLQLLEVEPSYPTHPLFDVMVSFHEQSQMKKISGAEIPGLQSQLVWSKGSKFKLMVEFIAIDDETLLMRLEHDTDIFEPGKVRAVSSGMIAALEKLIDASDVRQDTACDDLAGTAG